MSNDTRVRLIAEIDATSKGLVDALKQASTAVNDTTGNWKSQFSSLKDATNTIGASVRNLSQLVKEVGNVDMNITGMEEIGKAISNVRGSFDSVKADVDAFVSSLSIMKAEAQQFGMPMEEFGRFSEAVKASGVSMSEALQMVKAMQEQIQALANGVPEAQATFDKLGLTIEQLSSNTVSANFESISQAINSTIPSSERATQNMNLFKSSIDKTMAVAQEYNKTISKQQGSYATDKDVQNATMLQNALAKLGDQLNGYASGASRASEEVKKMSNAQELDVSTLKSSISEQSKYNASLDTVIAKLSNAMSAYERFAQSLGNKEVFNVQKIADGNFQPSETFANVLKLLDEENDKLLQIIDIQTRLGVPIDTQYLEAYKHHIEEVIAAFNSMRTTIESDFNNRFFDDEQTENLKGAIESIEQATEKLNGKLEYANQRLKGFTLANNDFAFAGDIEKAQRALESFSTKIEDARGQMARGFKPVIDLSDLDKAREAIASMESHAMDFKIDKSLLTTIQESMVGVMTTIAELHHETDGVVTAFSTIPTDKVDELQVKFEGAFDAVKNIADAEKIATANTEEFAQYASDAVEKLQVLKQGIKELEASQNIRFIDIREIDKAIDAVKTLEKITVQPRVDASHIEHFKMLLEGANSEVKSINDEVQRGIPVWQPVVTQARRFWTVVKANLNPINAIKNGWNAIGDAIAKATDKLSHFKYKNEETKKSTQNIGSVLKQATGQIMGMGSAVAVVVKAWTNLVALAKAYAKSVIEARNAALWGNGLDSMQQMTQIRTKQESRYNSAQSMMKEMAQAHDDWKETNNQESYNKFKILENRLDKLYHITFKHDSGGQIVNIDQQITDRMKDFRAKTLEAIDGGIKQAQQIMNSANQFLKDASYWDEVLDRLGGINSMEDAAKATQQAQQTIADLTEARTKIRAIDPSREFMRERNGAREQKEYEQAKKEHEERKKTEKERVKKLQEGTKKLEDWENSLTDNERQKEYRSIMAKYNEAIEAGIKEEEARRVATEAITALLKKEEAEEKKKNQELLDAVQKKIDAYKQTYQRYLDAEKSLVDAKRQYADAQKDLAREAKAERIQRRREEIARKLRTFGFTLPEEFDINETNRQRTERRRNRKNDASIGEKLAQWQEGRNVHWTKAERERLGEYQALQSKDKELEAVQKQMDAAQQTENAAERLGSAADAVRDAALKFNEMRNELIKARNEMNDAMDKKKRTHTNEADPKDIFDELKKGNYAGVKEPKQRYKYDYSDLDEKVLDDEKKMRRRQEKDIEFDTGVETVVRKAKMRDRRNKGLEINGKPDSVENGRGLRINGTSSTLMKGQGLRMPRSDSRGIVGRQQLKGLKAPGLAGLQTKQINYSDSLSMIHRDLVEMARKTFRVK